MDALTNHFVVRDLWFDTQYPNAYGMTFGIFAFIVIYNTNYRKEEIRMLKLRGALDDEDWEVRLYAKASLKRIRRDKNK